MIYLDDNLAAYSEDDLKSMLCDISEERVEKISRLHGFGEKLRSALAYLILKEGLKLEYGSRFDKMPLWEYGPYGKPRLAGHPDIHFNLSHCEKAVACVISSDPVGIDVETIGPFDEELARYISSQREFEVIMMSPDPALAFTTLWTKKESYCKLTGHGLDSRESIIGILNSGRAIFNTQINTHARYVMTVCCLR